MATVNAEPVRVTAAETLRAYAAKLDEVETNEKFLNKVKAELAAMEPAALKVLDRHPHGVVVYDRLLNATDNGVASTAAPTTVWDVADETEAAAAEGGDL